jgi:16S rRNA (guanine527-N7)-methyltransferase
VKRVRELAARWGVDPEPLERMLAALAAEPDPPTTLADPVAGHLADSLSALPELPPAPGLLADVGAGAGFPGLVLAAALPATRVVLLESQRRHAAVAERLAAAAGLRNVSVVAARAEEWVEGLGACDVVTARAVAPLAVLVEYAAPLLALGGRLVAWKGARDAAEERAGEAAAAELGLTPLRVVAVHPFPDAHSRHLHLFEKSAPTPDRYPRRAGMARKRPLAR